MKQQVRQAMFQFVQSVETAGADEERPGGSVTLGERSVGGRVSRGSGAAREHMRETLDQAIARQRRFALVPLGLAVVLFAVALVFVIVYAHKPAAVAAIFGASGVSVSVPFVWTTKTLRQLWMYELTAAAMPTMTNKALAELAKTVLDKMDGGPGDGGD